MVNISPEKQISSFYIEEGRNKMKLMPLAHYIVKLSENSLTLPYEII